MPSGNLSGNKGTVRLIRVFVSSPGDIGLEREVISEVCDEINLDFGRHREFRVEPIKWESHTTSSAAERSQEVINRQIGDYEIYLGLMGFYFGSNTGQYGSGTAEEFAIARKRNMDNGAPKLQFYFSNAKFSPDDLDLVQYQKVREFREEVRAAGILTKGFKNLTQLRLEVRRALFNDILEILADDKVDEALDSITTVAVPNNPYDKLSTVNAQFKEDPEVAVQVLSISSARRMNKLTQQVNVAASKIAKFGSSMIAATKEARAVERSGKNPKYLIKKFAKVFETMEDFNTWLVENVDLMEEDLKVALSSIQRLVQIQREISLDFHVERAEFLEVLQGLRGNMLTASEGLEEFMGSLATVEGLGQRWTGNAKLMRAALQDFVNFSTEARQTIIGVEEQLGG